MQIEHKILPFEMKASSADGSTFEGYANAFNNIDLAGEIVVPGAFTDSLSEFMTSGFIGGLNHNWDMPIGRPMTAKEDERGLFVKGKISDTEHGRDCRVLLKDGVITKMSIGYRVKGDETLDTAEEVANYWQRQGYSPSPSDIAAAQHGARLLTKILLYEFSPVTVPCNSLADITGVKRYATDEIETERQFERFLREAGFSRDAAKTICAVGFKALRQRDVEEAQPPEVKLQPEPSPEPPPATTTLEAKTEPVIEPALIMPVLADAIVVVDAAVKGSGQNEAFALYQHILDRRAALYRR